MAKRKKKVENKRILALEVYNDIFTTEPNFENEIVEMLKEYRNQGNRWNEDLVYCPIRSIIMERTKQFMKCSKIIREYPASIISAIASWNLSKVIYRFDTDFLESLKETEDTNTVPVEALMHLPYKCFCLQIGEESRLIFQDYDQELDSYELRIEILKFDYEHNSIDEQNLFLILTSKDFQKCIDDSIEATIRDFKISVPNMAEMAKDHFCNESRIFKETIQMILFIQSQNADIIENEKNAEARRRYNCNRTGVKKIPTVLDTGYRVGAEIRHIKEINVYKDEEEGVKETNAQSLDISPSAAKSKKTPHVRRAHWHHFWIGSEKAGTRKLVIRWLPPMAIGSRLEDLAPVVHDIRV